MADLFQMESQLKAMEREGKTLSTSKSYAKLYNQYKDAKKSSPLGSYGGGFSSILDKAMEMANKAVRPAVSSLESSIPEIATKYGQQRQQLEGEKEPLVARYENIINSIRGSKETAVNRQTLATRNELGKRGISMDSGIAEQEVVNAVNPITKEYTGLEVDAGLERETALRNLANMIASSFSNETAETRGVRNMIGQLLGNAGNLGISSGLNMANMQQSAGQFQDQMRFNQQNSDRTFDLNKLAQQLAQNKFNQIELPMTRYELGKPYYSPNTGSSNSGVPGYSGDPYG